MRSTGTTSIYVLALLATVLWISAAFCLYLSLDRGDRLPGVVPTLVATGAGVATLGCGQRWMVTRMREDFLDIVDAYLVDRLVPQAFKSHTPQPAAVTIAGIAEDGLPDGVAAKIYDLGRRSADRDT